MTEEQVRPLAPATDRQSSDEEEAASNLRKIRRRKFIRCCGCISSFMIVQAVVIIILIFTVFKVKNPVIKINGIEVTRLDLINGSIPRPGVNMSLVADISVKNPNVASFKYRNTMTALFYRGTEVGEARTPPGKSKARRTMRMNVSVDIITDRLISNPNLRSDIGSGILAMSSYTRVGGRVKILFIKKYVVVKMNCTIAVNITSQAIQKQKCKRSVKL